MAEALENTVGERGRAESSRKKWKKSINIIVYDCYLRSSPEKRGYRKRLKKLWDEKGVFETTEQRLADQVRAIKTNGWLTKLEIEEIERKINAPQVNSENLETDEQPEYNLNENIEIEPQNIEDIIQKAVSEDADAESVEYLRKVYNEFVKNDKQLPPNLRYVERKRLHL